MGRHLANTLRGRVWVGVMVEVGGVGVKGGGEGGGGRQG